MINDLEHRLLRLQAYNDSPSIIVSLYINLLETTNPVETCDTLIKQILPEPERVQNNLDIICGFLSGVKKRKDDKALAIFSGGDNFFEELHLPFSVETQLALDHSPFLKPILESQTTYHRYLVILIDRTQAKLFTLVNGAVEEQKQITDTSVPQQVSPDREEAANAGGDDQINRHIDELLTRHFARIAGEADQFILGKQVSGIFIGGHRNYFSKFTHQLPKHLQQKVRGEFVSELKTTLKDILIRSQKLVEETDKQITTQKISLTS